MRPCALGSSALLAVAVPVLALGASCDIPASCHVIFAGKLVTHVDTGFDGTYCVINGVSIGKAKEEENLRKRIDDYADTEFVADMVSEGATIEDAVVACVEREHAFFRDLERTIIALPSSSREGGALPPEIRDVVQRYHDVADTLWYDRQIGKYAYRYRSDSVALIVDTELCIPEALEPDPLFYSRLVEGFINHCGENGGLLVMASSGAYALMYGKLGIDEALRQFSEVEASHEYVQGPISRSLLVDILDRHDSRRR